MIIYENIKQLESVGQLHSNTLVKTYTNEGDVVLDNTFGSGTTILAAIKNNRRFIGIEKDENYYNIAVRRVSEYCR